MSIFSFFKKKSINLSWEIPQKEATKRKIFWDIRSKNIQWRVFHRILVESQMKFNERMNETNAWMNEWMNELEYQNPIDYQLQISLTYLSIKSLSLDYFWWNDFYLSFQFTCLTFEKNKEIIMFQRRLYPGIIFSNIFLLFLYSCVFLRNLCNYEWPSVET